MSFMATRQMRKHMPLRGIYMRMTIRIRDQDIDQEAITPCPREDLRMPMPKATKATLTMRRISNRCSRELTNLRIAVSHQERMMWLLEIVITKRGMISCQRIIQEYSSIIMLSKCTTIDRQDGTKVNSIERRCMQETSMTTTSLGRKTIEL